MCLGWTGPLTVIIPYFVHKYLYDNEFCWMDDGWSSYILGIPTAVILVMNSLIAVSVIVTIKNSSFAQQNRMSMTKYARAVLILMSIFGLQFILLPMRPQAGTKFEIVYETVSCLGMSNLWES